MSYLAGRSGFGDEEEQRQDVHFISEIIFFSALSFFLVQDVRDGGEPLDPPEMETTRPSPVSRSVLVSSFTGEAQPFFFLDSTENALHFWILKKKLIFHRVKLDLNELTQ